MKTLIVALSLALPIYGISGEEFHPSEGQKRTRTIPVVENGKVVGHKVVSESEGKKTYEKLGLKRGDVLRSIDGITVESPQQAMELYRKAQAEGYEDMEVERSEY